YGPVGIGATYTIARYQQQHQYPFRTQLKDKVFNGHIARFAEGNYAGFFGWPNLTNTPTGGFLGLPGNDTRADMRVVDIYRRDGDKLAENWVFIDLLHWLSMQGLDLLARIRSQRA
ncbi:MAG: ester cyclase, partial [Woeseiaceae bacterium]